MEDFVKLAEKIAREKHDGQFRRDGVTPYITHIEAVVSRVAGVKSDKVTAAAWLHDIIEDTDATAQYLFDQGIPSVVVLAVSKLTKSTWVSYEDYLKEIGLDEIAIVVKVADMLSNLSDEPTAKQIIKYSKGLLFLLAE